MEKLMKVSGWELAHMKDEGQEQRKIEWMHM